VTYRGASQARWRIAIALAAALCVFTAVVTGWAARGSALAGVALPQLATASHEAQAGPAPAGEHATEAGHSFHSDAPLGQKFTKNAWMTRERPPTRPQLAPDAVWSPLPASLAASGVPPGSADPGDPTPALVDRDLLTHLCVARL
jgi:hypothetical protein